MKDKEKKESFKSRMVTTADLYSKRKKEEPEILSTHSLPDVLPVQRDGGKSSLKKMISTSKDVKEKKQNEE